MRTFWTSTLREPPRIRALEAVSVLALLTLCGALSAAAGPAMALARTTAGALHDRGQYVQAVLGAEVRRRSTPEEGRR